MLASHGCAFEGVVDVWVALFSVQERWLSYARARPSQSGWTVDWTIGVRFRTDEDSLDTAGSGAHSAAYLMYTGCSYPRLKCLRREVDHLLPPGAGGMNVWYSTSTADVVISWCLVKRRNKFTFNCITLVDG